ncbi:MAG: hypothetical protein OQJ81_10040 [Melioribacteraceae bacterium]|nr:hypothetical protein [Melioribacteraceae bacterium]
MAGNTIIIILLIPIAFQVFLLAIKQQKRHRELLIRLQSIEEILLK